MKSTGGTQKTTVRAITQDLIMDATNLTRSSSESTEKYLKKVTHLHLQNKRIKVLDGLKICPNLKVLYMYDNYIEHIENLNDSIYLQYVQLQGNVIRVIPDLRLQNLQKIYLDHNEISFVAGFELCTQLIELHISNQKLPDDQPLQFDPKSLEAIANTLTVLNIAGNNIFLLEPFRILKRLQILDTSNNKIENINEILDLFYSGIHLNNLNASENPITTMKDYRNIIIAQSSNYLEVLDDSPVTILNHTNIEGLMNHRHKLYKYGKVVHQEPDPHSSNSQNSLNFTV